MPDAHNVGASHGAFAPDPTGSVHAELSLFGRRQLRLLVPVENDPSAVSRHNVAHDANRFAAGNRRV